MRGGALHPRGKGGGWPRGTVVLALAAVVGVVIYLNVNMLSLSHIRGSSKLPRGDFASLPDVSNIKSPSNPRKEEIHIVFSTDCSPFQDYQSIALIWSALQAGQGKYGGVTRIASGCTDEEQQTLKDLYSKLFPLELAHIHFTPDFKVDKKTGKKYDFYNKPYGMLHWMTYADYDHSDIIALIDPDMIFLRPITADIAGASNLIFRPRVGLAKLPPKVVKGHPVAQTYGIGGDWVVKSDKFNLTYICGSDSPCLKTSAKEGDDFYSVGPPYIAHRDDMEQIVKTWVDFVPRVFEGYPHLLAEMYAYAMAAAHHNLPHIQLDQYMVSGTHIYTFEGWTWIDKLVDVCPPELDTRPLQGPLGKARDLFSGHELPSLLHYCQFYRIGLWGFHKKRVPKSLFSCNDDRLFDEVPGHAVNITVKIKESETVRISPRQARNEVFALCVLTRLMNDILLYYRHTICPNAKPEAQQDKTLNLALISY